MATQLGQDFMPKAIAGMPDQGNKITASGMRHWGVVLFIAFMAQATPLRAAIAPWEIATLAAGAVGIGFSEVYKKNLVPEKPRWERPPEFDAEMRRKLVWSDTKLAARLSDVLLFGVLPVAAFGAPLWTEHNYARAAFTVAQSAVATGVVTQLTKFAVARARPYAYYSNDYSEAGSKLSFFSGHTSYAFAFAVSGAMLVSERYPRYSGWIYATALSLAALTGYLRIAADKHYLTDVLTGAAVGSAIAYTVTRYQLSVNAQPFGDERRLQLQKVFVLQ
ncbi:MAG: phosphatase PAP2 family protein [Turneriella sp.]|nr:phosphatase PAP2 family protein [Turneriella sp.]